MNSFYGNQYRSDYVPLVWDKIYTNYSDMAAGAETDGVLVGRCVFVDGSDNSGYAHTVWQKVSCNATVTNNDEDSNTTTTTVIKHAYKLIACLDSKRSMGTDLKVIKYAPSAHKFEFNSAETNISDNGDTSSAEEEEDSSNSLTINGTTTSTINTSETEYYIVHSVVSEDGESQSLTIEPVQEASHTLCLSDFWKIGYDENSTFNEEGFNSAKQSKITDDINDRIEWIDASSGSIYPVTSDTSEDDAPDSTNYNMMSNKTQIDTKKLKVYLPSIGNAISDMWDLIYPLDADETDGTRDTSWPSDDDGAAIPLATIATNMNNTVNGKPITKETVDEYIDTVITALATALTTKSASSNDEDSKEVAISDE